ncbi:MAG TPA: kynureninase [Sphingobacteriaceae bacterium]
MNYTNSLEFARSLDRQDPLYGFRKKFLIPRHSDKEITYLCGNSLGLQPRSVKDHIQQQLDNWGDLAVEGWFDGDDPWIFYHKEIQHLLAPIVGAKPEEVIPMNTLTVNVHLMMVSFYKPTVKRFKILMEGGAFPSDQYAVESQIRFHDLNPDDTIIEVFPREGEETLRSEDILAAIETHGDELALILFGGINYYTGQLFNLKKFTEAGHAVGAYVGFDLAHAAGNVVLNLHDWNVDFACWCSYKYMNSSPGGISGVFVHERHFNSDLNRLAGWWGYQQKTRFLMEKGFIPEKGAEGWLISCNPVLLLSAHKASLKIFEEAGGMMVLRAKSEKLTGFLEFLVRDVNAASGDEIFRIITPADPSERGCQLSLIARKNGKMIFDKLVERRIIGDWREPDVIRVSPVPLYNTFEEVYEFGKQLRNILSQC